MDVPFMELRMLSSNLLNSLDPGIRRDDEVVINHEFMVRDYL